MRSANVWLLSVLVLVTLATAFPIFGQGREEIDSIDSRQGLLEELVAQSMEIRSLEDRGRALGETNAVKKGRLTELRDRAERLRERSAALSGKLAELESYFNILELPAAIDRQLGLLRPAWEQDLERRETLMTISGSSELPEPTPEMQALGDWVGSLEDARVAIADMAEGLEAPNWIPEHEEPHAYRNFLESEVRLANERLAESQAESESLVRGIERAVSGLNEELGSARQRFVRIVNRLHRDFYPSWINEVKVFGIGADYHYMVLHGVYGPARFDEELLAGLQGLLDQHPQAILRLGQIAKAREIAVANFEDVSRRWNARHDDYLRLQRSAYYLKITLELADSGLAIWRGGPVGTLFEAGWRLYEAGSTDATIDEPVVSGGFVEYRDYLSKQSNYPGAEIDTEKLRLEFNRGEDALHKAEIWDNQLGELIKGVVGAPTTTFFEEFSRWMARRSGEVGRDQASQFMNAYGALIFNPGMKWSRWREMVRSPLVGGHLDELSAEIARSIPNRGNRFIAELKGLQPWKDIGHDFLIGAAVTFGKDVVEDAAVMAKWRRAAYDLAVLDIEWYVRRHEMDSASAAHRRAEQVYRDYLATIEKLSNDIYLQPIERDLTIVGDGRIWSRDKAQIDVTPGGPDWQGLAVDIGFLPELFQPSGSVLTSGEIPTRAGRQTLEFSGSSWLDLDPGTVARLDIEKAKKAGPEALVEPARLFLDLDESVDARLEIEVVEANLEITNAGHDNEFEPGASVAFSYEIPPPGASLLESGEVFWVEISDSTPAVRVDLQAQVYDGIGQIRAPESERPYRLSLRAPRRDDDLDYDLFTVKALTPTPIPTPTASPKPTPGPTATPTPTGPDDDRLLIRVVGSELEYFSGRRFRPIFRVVDELGRPLPAGLILRARQTRTIRDEPDNILVTEVPLEVHYGGVATYEWFWGHSRDWGGYASFSWQIIDSPGIRLSADSAGTTVHLN